MSNDIYILNYCKMTVSALLRCMHGLYRMTPRSQHTARERLQIVGDIQYWCVLYFLVHVVQEVAQHLSVALSNQ